MRLLTTVVSLLFLCTGNWALHESDVGVVDWQKQLVGVPLSGSISTAPSFHRSGNKSIILTATGNNVLAALEPDDGSVLWRYIFDPEDRIVGYYKNGNVVATLSGAGGTNLRTFDALSGQLLVEKRLHSVEKEAPSEPVHFGKYATFSPDSENLYVLSDGYSVTSVDGITGESKWTWSPPDQDSLVTYIKLIPTPDAIYAIGVAKSFASYMLHVTTLSPSTGEVINSAKLSSSIVDPLSQFISLTRAGSSQPMMLWLEQGALRYIDLTPTLNQKAKALKGTGYAKILDVGLDNQGHVVIVRDDGSSLILRFDAEIGLAKSIWEFQDSAVSKDNADSIYAGGTDALGQPYIARVYWSHKLRMGSADVFAGHLVSGQGLASGLYFPFDTKSHGVIRHVALDPENAEEESVKSRLFVTTSTAAIQLWEQGKIKWTREESLAAVVVADLVEIPERVASESVNNDATEGFLARLLRQISDAQDFPQYVVNFVRRFITGSYASPITPATPKSNNPTEGISRDTFGFRQVIVAATAFGKVFGIDSTNGEIIWSRVLGLGWADEVGGRIQPVKLFVTRTVSDGGDPEVVLVTQRHADNSLVDTVVFHLDAITGADSTGQSKDDAIFEGHDVIQGPLVEGYLLNAATKVVVLLDEFLQVYLYPDNPRTQAAFASVAHRVSFPLRANVQGRQRVMGHEIGLSENKHRSIAHPTWSLTLSPGENVQALVPQIRGPVASIGKVLGNRTTLYKYLNTRLFTVLTISPARSMCGLYVVDSAKGTVIYHVELKATLKGCDIKTTLVENWLVYHYYEGEIGSGTANGAKGYRMVSIEFYEGQKEDEKTESSDLSSFSNDTINFMKLERAFIFPHAVTAMSVTSTKFGISSKELIVATKNNRIQSFPRRLLDPRRPKRKLTAEEQEELLIQYDPVLPNDPHRVLSHNYDIANIHGIVTSPALLESTSLVFAFGLDLFITRIAPSGTFDVLNENFNKAQLVFTVSGLLLAILISRPMVERKRLREKWYQ